MTAFYRKHKKIHFDASILFYWEAQKLRDTSLQENINLGYVRCILYDLRQIFKVDSPNLGFQDIFLFLREGGQLIPPLYN